jgi:hypothetical protein
MPSEVIATVLLLGTACSDSRLAVGSVMSAFDNVRFPARFRMRTIGHEPTFVNAREQPF